MDTEIVYSKIIITGANGWLGKRIVKQLIETHKDFITPVKASDIYCLVKPMENYKKLSELKCNIIYGDIRNIDDLESLFSDAKGSLVFHIAGVIHPPGRTKYFQQINVQGTKNILEISARKRVKRLVVMSSNSPMGTNPETEHLFTEISPYDPYMAYGRSKWKMELILKTAMQQSDYPEITIIRAPWFYGPGQPARQIEFFNMIKAGKFPIMGKGLNTRSMAYIDNLAEGIILSAFKKQAVNQIFWIADEKPYTMLEIVTTVKSLLKNEFNFTVSRRNLHVPAFIADVAQLCDLILQKFGFYQQKIHVLSEMNKNINCDISKAKRILGYRPKISLKEGMRKSIEYALPHIK